MAKLSKPPIGVVPCYIHNQRVENFIGMSGGVHMDSIHKGRAVDISHAILRYISAGLPVDREWIDEYNGLVNHLNKR